MSLLALMLATRPGAGAGGAEAPPPCQHVHGVVLRPSDRRHRCGEPGAARGDAMLPGENQDRLERATGAKGVCLKGCKLERKATVYRQAVGKVEASTAQASAPSGSRRSAAGRAIVALPAGHWASTSRRT